MAKGTYKVRKGDTLSAIARANGITLKELMAVNPQITDPSLVKVNQIINLPDKVQAQANADQKQLSVDVNKRNVPVGSGGAIVDDGGSAISDAAAAAKETGIDVPGITAKPNPNLYSSTLPQDTFSKQQLAAKFSIAAAILDQDPSLVEALNKILGMSADGKTKVGPVITDPKLQEAILKETDYFKKHTDDWRAYQFYKDSNPETYKADLKLNAEAIIRKWYAVGITIDPETAIKLAEQAMMKSATVDGEVVNYNQSYFDKLMAASIDFSKKQILPNGKIVYDLGGKIETIAKSLYQAAWDYGYQATVSNKGFSSWLENNVRGLIAGTVNPEDVDDELVNRARSLYPGLTDQLNRGQTLREAADPWINAIANELEEDPRSFDLNDNMLYMAINSQDEKGNIAPMNLYQAKVMARKSPKWQYTGRAKEEYTNIGQKILQDFGFLG